MAHKSLPLALRRRIEQHRALGHTPDQIAMRMDLTLNQVLAVFKRQDRGLTQVDELLRAEQVNVLKQARKARRRRVEEARRGWEVGGEAVRTFGLADFK